MPQTEEEHQLGLEEDESGERGISEPDAEVRLKQSL